MYLLYCKDYCISTLLYYTVETTVYLLYCKDCCISTLLYYTVETTVYLLYCTLTVLVEAEVLV